MNNTLLKSAVLTMCIILLAAFTFVNVKLDQDFDKTVQDDPSKPLVKYITSLAKQADTDKNVYVGYRINVRESFKDSHIRIKSNHTINNRHEKSKSYTTEKKLFYKFKNGESIPSGLLLQQQYYEGDLSGEVIWVEGVSTQRSLEAAISFVNQDKNSEADLLAVVAFHPGEKASEFLFNFAKNEVKQERRKNGIFWYAQTIEGEGLGKLPELEKIHTTNDDKEVLIFSYSTLGNKAAYERVKNYAHNSNSADLVEQAIFWMGQFENVDASADLMKLFDLKKNNDIREKIIFALSQTKSKAAGEFLVKIARSDASPDLRENAIFWLGQIEEMDVLPLLKELYAAASKNSLKEKIIFSLCQMEDERAYDFVAEIARGDEPVSVREHAVFLYFPAFQSGKSFETPERDLQE
jgi:hypothetical protein